MNLDVERIPLIDFTIEDDFLIDSDFDNAFVDLRLSVTFETQNELLGNTKSMARHGMKGSEKFFDEKERETFRPDKKNGDKECNSRKSLAWDHAFYTSPGFLELEELCLVNSGFKNLDVSPSHGNEDNVRSKLSGQERCSSTRSSVGTVGRLRSQPSMKTKVASPSKMVPMQGAIRQLMTTGRSETVSRSAAAKSQFNDAISKKESVKCTGIMGQTRVSTVHTKKPPSRAINRYGPGMVVSQEPYLRSSNSVLSSQSLMSSYATSRSVDRLPCKTSMGNVQTASSLNSQEMQGGSFSYELNASLAYNLEGHRNNHRGYSGIKQSLGQDGLRQTDNAAETKRSPFSSRTSSLRMPSQKIGFFDMKLETSRRDQDCTSNKGQRRRSQPSKKQTHSLEFEEKENIFHPEDTVIELALKKGSPSPSPSSANSSSTSTGQCSSASKKCLTKAQRPARQTLFSPTPRTRTSHTKVSPLKKNAIF